MALDCRADRMALRDEKFFSCLHSCINKAEETNTSIWLIFSRLQQEKQQPPPDRTASGADPLTQSYCISLHLVHTQEHTDHDTRLQQKVFASSGNKTLKQLNVKLMFNTFIRFIIF